MAARVSRYGGSKDIVVRQGQHADQHLPRRPAQQLGGCRRLIAHQLQHRLCAPHYATAKMRAHWTHTFEKKAIIRRFADRAFQSQRLHRKLTHSAQAGNATFRFRSFQQTLKAPILMKLFDILHCMQYFQQMLKLDRSLKITEHRAMEALTALLEQVPAIASTAITHEALGLDQHADILAHVEIAGRRHTLICEVKSSGQPRHVRSAVLQLRNAIAHYGSEATALFIAPYLTPEAQTLCREYGVGFLDFEGNARLAFNGVFIERLVPGKPPTERRELRSIFKPKAAQVLRVMLLEPRRSWRVTDLAAAADVSLGHVSNVRIALLDREWAAVNSDGLFLSEPDALLDAWRDAYVPPPGKRLGFYTTRHGTAFDEAARTAFSAVADKDGGIMFASFSAAHWLAPYARTGSQFFYADEAGVETLRQVLNLSSSAKGENVVITQLEDRGLFRDALQPAPGIICTGQVQTYLDLAASGERGREAADHLRRERLAWPR